MVRFPSFNFILNFGVADGDGISVGSWFCRWKLVFLMDIDWFIYLFIYYFDCCFS